ncbi:MAG TPA: DNA polymerase III subunit alpha [Solirubrobacterales bacterium]
MYTELHCHSAYSFLDGASDPAELAATAAGLGHEALALTDHDNVCGAMEFAHACKGVGVRPIFGCELTLEVPRRMPRPVHVTLLVENASGWASLCRLITGAHRGTRDPASPLDGSRSRAPSHQRYRAPSHRRLRAPSHLREPLPPSLPIDELERHTEGLVCLSGCARDGAVAGTWERGDPAGAVYLAERLLRAFSPDRFRIELQRPLWRHDRSRNRWLASLAERLGVPAVATGDAHAHERSRMPLQDALVAVRLGATLDETEGLRRGNSASVLLSSCEGAPRGATRLMQGAARFRDHPEAVAETERLAERLRFDLTRELGYSYPGAEDGGADRRLAELCRTRLIHRYEGTPQSAEAGRRLEEELALIRGLRLSGFFLLHQDMLELAREVAVEVRGPDSARRLLPPGRGRGSSVSSLVCYLTGLSHIDPVKNDLFLGRFLNEELTEVPDIDLDFPRDIREKLIPRVHERYGPERSALVASFATYRARGAIRDLGKALGLPQGEVERFARGVDVYEASRDAWARMEETLGKLRARSPRWRALAELLPEIAGLPRHISQHPGGMVISTTPLIELCPVQPAAMEERQIVQWDKDSCADAGFLKIDLLGLGMLSAVERCVDEIARTRGERIDLSRVPLDDDRVWSRIQRAETTGVFQIESRAQMQMLPRTLPQDLDDLTVQVALVRPGPIQGGAVHPYIERRKRLREDPGYEIPYEHPSLEPVLRDTLGAIVFQDQVLEVSMALAGFSVGEAEGLRRAMSRKRSEAAMLRYRERFIEGAVGRGVAREVAERVFGQIEGFSGFGFPKAHSAAFGLLAYQSMWLRVHYGPELLCGLLNEQPMGFYPPDALVHEAQRRGVEILPPDVNVSEVDCRVETTGAAAGSSGNPPVRIGLGYVSELAVADAEAVVAERRRGGTYRSVSDLAGRSGAGAAALQRLAWAGACDSLIERRVPAAARVDRGAHEFHFEAPAGEGPADPDEDLRRPALWEAGGAARASRTDEGAQLALPLDGSPTPPLPALGPWDRIVADYRTTGMTLGKHPMELLRKGLSQPETGSSSASPAEDPRILSSSDIADTPDGTRVKVAGMVVARQRPATANGVVFMLLEDERGTINLIVSPPVVERCRLAVRTSGFVQAAGKLEHREGTTNVVVSRIERLTPTEPQLVRARELEAPVTAHELVLAGHSAVGLSKRGFEGVREAAMAELAASLPAPHSFGRRGR